MASTRPVSATCTAAPESGVTIRSIVRGFPIPIGRYRNSTGLRREVTSARNEALAAGPRSPGRASELEIGRLRLPAIIEAPSVARRAARPQERIAIMDFRAWVRPGVAAAVSVAAAGAVAVVAAGV